MRALFYLAEFGFRNIVYEKSISRIQRTLAVINQHYIRIVNQSDDDTAKFRKMIHDFELLQGAASIITTLEGKIKNIYRPNKQLIDEYRALTDLREPLI